VQLLEVMFTKCEYLDRAGAGFIYRSGKKEKQPLGKAGLHTPQAACTSAFARLGTFEHAVPSACAESTSSALFIVSAAYCLYRKNS
jgi:hypothetical protein